MTNATRTMLTMKRDTTTVSMKHVTKMTLIMTTTDHFLDFIKFNSYVIKMA